MNDAPIQIRNPEVTRALRELAEERGLPITETVGQLVKAELGRLRCVSQAERDRRKLLMEDAVRRLHELPIIGPMLTDDDLYDEDGMPK